MSESRAITARLPAWVLTAAFLGVLAGVVFGERTAFLQPVGLAYAMMLESVVYPYLLSSLIGGLGGLAQARAWRLLRASWSVYLALWLVAFAMILALGAAIPAPPPPAAIVPGAHGDAMPLVSLLIPSNIVDALSRNYVPAVVVFAVAFGVAIQTIERKANFLETIEVVRRGSLKIWNWVVYFAPIGVFALFASTAGTIQPEAAGTLTVYLVLFLIGTLVLAFVVLPLGLSAIAPANARELLAEFRPALVLAVVTTLSVSALPFIQSAAERILAKAGVAGEEARDVIQAQLSLAYVFVQLGNYFIALFILFASYHFHVALTVPQHALLPVMSLLSGIGSPSATVEGVEFLSQWIGMPSGAAALYIESMTVTRYGQVVLSVIAFGVATIAVPLIYFGKVRMRPVRLGAALAAGAGVALVVIVASRAVEARLFPQPSDAEVMARTLDPALAAGIDVTVYRPGDPLPDPIDGPATLEGVRQRGVLRVGYGYDVVPFTYFNGAGELVGFDASYAYRLARDLHVRLEFVPVDWESLSDDLAAHHFDIVMGGAYATDQRLQKLKVTEPYYVSPLAMIARSESVQDFLHYDQVAARGDLTLGVFSDPVLLPMLNYLFPQARIVTLGSYDELPDHPDITAAIWSFDQARAWAASRRGYTAVETAGLGPPLIFAYLLPPQSPDIPRFMDQWMSLRAGDGFREDQIAYWIRGEPRQATAPRWNLLDAVLGRAAPTSTPTPTPTPTPPPAPAQSSSPPPTAASAPSPASTRGAAP